MWGLRKQLTRHICSARQFGGFMIPVFRHVMQLLLGALWRLARFKHPSEFGLVRYI
jgi:hypothetical protein